MSEEMSDAVCRYAIEDGVRRAYATFAAGYTEIRAVWQGRETEPPFSVAITELCSVKRELELDTDARLKRYKRVAVRVSKRLPIDPIVISTNVRGVPVSRLPLKLV